MLYVGRPFDPEKDIQEVVQEGYLEIRDCLEHGMVPGDLALTDAEETNGIEDPRKIAGSVRDRFAAEREKKRLAGVISTAQANNPAPAVTEE